MIFITASPLLARNVSKLYHRVLNYLKCQLRDKEKKNQADPSSEKKIDEEAKKKELEEEFEVIGEDELPSSNGHPGEDANKLKEEGARIVNEALEDFDLKILEEAEKEIEQMMDEINIEEDRSEIPNSFYKVDLDNFPLFLTLREFMYLMDSLMGTSFFVRNIESIIRAGIKKSTGKKGYYRHKDTTAGNRIYDNILYREIPKEATEVELSSDDEEQHQVFKMSNENEEGKDAGPLMLSDTYNIKSEDLVTEVDFEDFKDIFYPEYLRSLKPSVMKKQAALPVQIIWQKIRNMDLQHMTAYESTSEVLSLCYNTYQAYKKWKERTGNYDLNDLYMHLNAFYENDVVANNLIDFLFIDEIQDIPLHLLNYLRRFGTKFFYFSGDNAQNISKGVTFKFRDLATSYNQYRSRKLDTVFHALTMNYRSHQQILRLGNNIVMLIRMLFPGLIEYLPPEESPSTGPKPIIVPLGQKVETLIEFMKANMGLKEEDKDELKENGSSGDRFKFANGQVFITRDYKTKQSLVSRFPNSIVLTILEAKGMEFDDVVLFNYFTDSESHKPVLYFAKALEVKQRIVSQIREDEVTKDTTVYYEKTDDGSRYIRYEITVDMPYIKAADSLYQQNQLSEAADELKLLYVAITRARKRVVIFDEVSIYETKQHSRSFFDEFWMNLNLVTPTTDTLSWALFRESAPFEKVKERRKWIKDGFEYLEKGIYEFAELCFKSGEFERGMTLANHCKHAHQLKKDYYLFEAVDSQSLEEKKELKEQRESIKLRLKELGDKFINQGWKSQAIQCYSIAGYLNLCGAILKKFGEYDKAADYFIEFRQYEEAFECYKLGKDYMGMMNCLHIVQNPTQILELYQLIKDKLPPRDKPKIKAMVKRKIKEIIGELNTSLLSDELPEKKEQNMNMEGIEPRLDDESVAIPDHDSEHPKPVVLEDRKISEQAQSVPDDDANSFEVVDMDDVMSNKGSFEYIKSDIDELEKLSESFVGVSIQDQKIVTNPSIFEEFGGETEERNFSFKEIQILTKTVNLLTELYEDFIQKTHNSSTEAEKIYELDMIEIPEFTANDMVTFLEESGAHSLRNLLEHKIGLKKHILGLLISYLYQTSPLHMSFVKQISVHNKDAVWKAVEGNYNENRRLATMSFLTVLQKFDQKVLRELLQKSDQETKEDTILIMILGYFRQLIHLLNHKDACTVLATFAEVQMLIMLKVNAKEVELFDKEAVFTDLFMAPGIRRISLIYSHFEDHPDIIHCSLLYFASHYLWEKRTYELADFADHVARIRNPFLRRALSFIKGLLDRNYEQVFEEILRLNNSKISLTNTLEAGYLAGVLVMCFYFNIHFFDESMVHSERFKKTHHYLKPLMNYFKEDILLKSTRNKFLEGMMLSMAISMVRVDCQPLTFMACFGALIHRNSCFLKFIAQSTVSPKGIYQSSMPPLTVADCGQEFYAVPYNYVLETLNSLCLIHQEEISKIS
jgi:hypothetical protein